MAFHDVEVADGFDSCRLRCTCGEECIGASWEDAGRKFDDHLNEAGVSGDGDDD